MLNACIYLLPLLHAECFQENTTFSMLKLLVFSTKSIIWLEEDQLSSALSTRMIKMKWWWSLLTFSHWGQGMYFKMALSLFNSSYKCCMIVSNNNMGVIIWVALVSLNLIVVWFRRRWIDISMHVQRDPTVCPSFLSWSLALSKGISFDVGLDV